MNTPQKKETSFKHQTPLTGWFMVPIQFDDVDDTSKNQTTNDENILPKESEDAAIPITSSNTAPIIEHYETGFYEALDAPTYENHLPPILNKEKELPISFLKRFSGIYEKQQSRLKSSETLSMPFLNSLEYYFSTSVVVFLLLMVVGLDAFGMGTLIHLSFLIVMLSSLAVMFATHTMKNEKK